MSHPNATLRPATARPIESVADATQLVSHLGEVMEALLGIVEQETGLVRAGKLNEAGALETVKTELARLYQADVSRVKANAPYLGRAVPDMIAALRTRHDLFQALLQINLTVLATAHAVSEGLMRGVHGELARKAAPQTYGRTGRQTAPGAAAFQPVTLSRSL